MPDRQACTTRLCLLLVASVTWAEEGPSLRTLAERRGIHLGAADGHAPFEELVKPLHERTFEREFAITTTYVDMVDLQPAQGEFHYEAYLDGVVRRNREAGTELFLSPLVWHDYRLPRWLTEGIWTRETLSDVLRTWIRATVARYRGQVFAWVVVNEPLSYESVALYNNVWRRVIGDDYIDLAFRWAHEADPDARLYINETNVETSDPSDPLNGWMAPRADLYHTLVRRLRKADVPLHGVGFQMHTHLAENGNHAGPRDPRGLAAELRRYANLDLRIAITEWDVAIEGASGTLDERLDRQAQVFRETMEVIVAQPAVEIVHIWGASDAVAEYPTYAGVPPEECQPVLFDVRYEPKRSYFAVREVLAGDAE